MSLLLTATITIGVAIVGVLLFSAYMAGSGRKRNEDRNGPA